MQGTGLGLALSRKLMAAMDGELGLEHHAAPEPPPTGNPFPGAVFWIELPRAERPQPAHDDPQAVSDAAGSALLTQLRIFPFP